MATTPTSATQPRKVPKKAVSGPALKRDINLISNFVNPKEVISIQLPFFCRTCDQNHFPVVTTESLRQNNLKLKPFTCPKCNGECGFDDDLL